MRLIAAVLVWIIAGIAVMLATHTAYIPAEKSTVVIELVHPRRNEIVRTWRTHRSSIKYNGPWVTFTDDTTGQHITAIGDMIISDNTEDIDHVSRGLP